VSGIASVVRTIDVDVDPATAFDVFTDEIGAWYKPGPYSWNDPERAVGIRFEPGVGGRWLEVWDEATGEGFEMGRILVWEPGERLVLSYRSVHLPPDPLTEVEVRFEALDGGTRVTLEHRGWERLAAVPEWVEKRAWVAFMGWFKDYLASRAERVSR
jgi:Activator of Hsp90 ATPase homolog 1-like protein